MDSCKAKEIRIKAWIPPAVSKMCFYVDGSSRGNPGNAGIGGVLRDRNGKILCLFSFSVGWVDAISAEIYAIHRACQLLIDKQHIVGRNITIFSDSKSVVSWCNGEDFGNLNLVNLVYDIRQLIQSWNGFEIKFLPRELNSFADCLAKNSSNGCGNRLEWGDLI